MSPFFGARGLHWASVTGPAPPIDPSGAGRTGWDMATLPSGALDSNASTRDRVFPNVVSTLNPKPLNPKP